MNRSHCIVLKSRGITRGRRRRRQEIIKTSRDIVSDDDDGAAFTCANIKLIVSSFVSLIRQLSIEYVGKLYYIVCILYHRYLFSRMM